MLVAQVGCREAGSFARHAGSVRYPCESAVHVFADGDEFHFGRDDALACIPELTHWMTGARAQWAAFFAGEMFKAVAAFGAARELFVTAREVAVVFRLHVAAFVFGDVVALQNPIATQRGDSIFDIAIKTGIAPHAARVVHAYRLIYLDFAVKTFR